jgi:hypothetical protein
MKNLLHFSFSAIIAFLIFTAPANAATFYVNAATGSNSNSSTQAKNIATPWLTVQFAIDNPAVTDGDNIVVAAGTYEGFTLTKRLNVIGAWKGSTPTVNTVFSSTVTLRAAGGSQSQRMVLKNLRADVTSGDAIDIRTGYVTLENVFAKSSVLYGVRFNGDFLNDIIMESCNFDGSGIAGIYIPTFVTIDGWAMKNSTIRQNAKWGVAAFQRRSNPTQVSNVFFSHCSFADNNPTNQQQGHTIYFEKLSNSTFENISVVMPANNNWIGIDINLLSRLDYSDISIVNSRVIRQSPGSGIWIQARNDLFDPPAALDTVVLRGLTFTNCDTNIAFNRQVKNMTVDKCDLSTYSVYGLVNYTDQGGAINANNNKWQNGGVPDTTVISGGLLTTGNNIISFMPSTDGIFVGMGIQGTGIPPNTFVTGKSPNTISMSNAATLDGFIPQIGFAFNFATSTDIVRTSLNTVSTGNPLAHSIINQGNVSFPNLASAISATNSGGTIWNVPSGVIAGNTIIDRDLRLISPGAGFLHSGSQTTFEDLTISGATLQMGSDFAVQNNFTPNRIVIGEDHTLSILGAIVPGGEIVGGLNSDMFFGGSSASTNLTTVQGGLRTLQINRANGIALADSLRLHRLLFGQNGLLSLGSNNLYMGPNSFYFSPSAIASYVRTDGAGEMKKALLANSITSFNFAVGNGGYAPALVYFGSWNLSQPAYANVRTVNTVHPNNTCSVDYLNRYWTVSQTGISSFTSTVRFGYGDGDVVGNEANIIGGRWDGNGWITFGPVNASTNSFVTTSLNAFGEFTGGDENCIGSQNTVINTKIYLQGAYIGGGNMRTSLKNFNLIPLAQPYSNSQYNYNGTESVGSIPAGVVDWVYLEVRSTSNGVPVPNGRRAAFLKSDGSVVDLDGTSPVKIQGVPTGNYFVVVGHRIHLPVMTANAVYLNGLSSVYDFSTGLNKYFGGDAATLAGGVFGLYSGDANKSFIVSAADYSVVQNNLLQSNYNDGDLNLNGTVTSSDFSFITINLAKASNVPNFQ